MIYTRLIALARQSFFLLGPRGTGKSTWIREALPETERHVAHDYPSGCQFSNTPTFRPPCLAGDLPAW